MTPNMLRRDLPPDCFPFVVEFYNPATSEMVHSILVEEPPTGEPVKITIPPLKKQLGYKVGVRVKFANGTIEEAAL